jgi:Ca2+/Na+ antiporter
MFGGTLGSAIAIGTFVLVIAAIYAALQLHHRSKTLDRERDRETRQLYVDARAQRDNLKYQGGVGTMAARPNSPTPNDIT